VANAGPVLEWWDSHKKGDTDWSTAVTNGHTWGGAVGMPWARDSRRRSERAGSARGIGEERGGTLPSGPWGAK
jgi:hypothetical protein